MDEKELKPCPFCGGAAHFERLGTPRQSCIVECDSCGVRHDSGDEGDMCGNSWNYRPALPSDAVRTLVTCSETLQQAIEQGNPLAAGIAVGLALQARERGFPGPDTPSDVAQAPVYQAMATDDDPAHSHVWMDVGKRDFDWMSKRSDIRTRLVYAAPVAPAAAAQPDERAAFEKTLSVEDSFRKADGSYVNPRVQADWEATQAKSSTAGMTLSERIAHVGGRENAAGYTEFGSVMAVDALIQHVLRDRTTAPQARADAEDAARLDWLDATNRPFKMGWRAAMAPAGNVSLGTIIQLGHKLTSVRDAIDAARKPR